MLVKRLISNYIFYFIAWETNFSVSEKSARHMDINKGRSQKPTIESTSQAENHEYFLLPRVARHCNLSAIINFAEESNADLQIEHDEPSLTI